MSRFADEQLLKSASQGDLAGVEQALKTGAEVDAKGTYNDSALNEACTWGHTEVVKRLLDAGADIENKGGANLTPIMNAASRGNFEIVPILLEKGARVSDDLLSIIQTKVNILEENAEGGMVRWEAVEAWKSFQDYLLTHRYRQDVPAMVSALAGSDEAQKREATRALAEAGRRGIDVSPAAEGLRPQLASSDADTRENASAALARCLAFGGDTGGLRALLEAKDEKQLSGAVTGLVYATRDGADVSSLVGPLAALLAHGLPDVRRSAALALAGAAAHKADIARALPALIGLLSDGDAVVRRSTAVAFYRIARSGVDVTSALPSLKNLLDDADGSVKAMAAKAVAAVSGEEE